MKKARYLMGMVGVAPAAVGLMVQGPAVAATHSAKSAPTTAGRAKATKRVSLHAMSTARIDVAASSSPGAGANSGCVGHAKHQRTVHSTEGLDNSVTLGFWSTKFAVHTCVGTIFVHNGGFIDEDSVYLKGKDGLKYCKRFVSPSHGGSTYGCHQSFNRPFSIVAIGTSTSTGLQVKDVYYVG